VTCAEPNFALRFRTGNGICVRRTTVLQFIGARSGQVKVIEGVAVRRNHGRIGNALRVLPNGRLRLEEGAECVTFSLGCVFPVSPDRFPPVAQAFLVGVAILRDDRRDPIRVLHGQPEAGRRTVIEHVDGIALKPATSVKRSIVEDGADAVVAALRARGVPFLLYTGYPTNGVPADVPVISKPSSLELVVSTLSKLSCADDSAKASRQNHTR
jgi:hypothetical protein